MIIETLHYFDKQGIKEKENHLLDADIVFIFGERETLKNPIVYDTLQPLYPSAAIVGSSSSCNILDDYLREELIVATAIQFESGKVKVAVQDFEPTDDIAEMGKALVQQLPIENLKHLFILSDGLHVNGSALANGINTALGGEVPVTLSILFLMLQYLYR